MSKSDERAVFHCIANCEVSAYTIMYPPQRVVVSSGEIAKIAEVFNAPNIDAVSVVRCDECKYCKEKGTSDCPSGYGYLYCTQKKSIVYEDDYCAWGEKR